MSLPNQEIVINDLLSFFSCKINVVPRAKLVKSIREYYSEGVILNAQKILLQSVPIKKSTRHGRRLKHPDPLEAMYDCFNLIPSEDLPIFVCRNLNNVPHLDPIKEVIKEETIDERELTIELDYENSHQDIKDEQIAMKSQIADITDVVKQIKDQLKHIVQQQPSPSKYNNLSINGTKRRKDYIKSSSNPNKKINALQIGTSQGLKKNPKTSMAYIQKLIDEEADVKSDCQYEDSQKDEYSDYLDEISEDEEKFVQSACEVILQENLEGLDQINMLKGTPVKMQGEKIIYIKNEEEDYEYDHCSELHIDDENSIEISSADHFSNFDEMDPSNRVFIERLGDGTISEREIPKLSSLDSKSTIKTKEHLLVQPKLWCSLCGEKFETEIDLIEHISYHENGSILKCSLCDFTTAIRSVIRNHLTTNHPEHFGRNTQRKRYWCVHCKFKTFSIRKIEIHVDTHFEKKNDSCYECDKCKKQYKSHSSLRKHKKVHYGKKPFVCPICADSFVFKSYLKTHMETHVVEKPLPCSFCNAKFTSKIKVIRHERIHTGERPYSCPECDFKCARTDTLQNHQQTVHAKDKPFECDKCGLSFSLKHQFKHHYQTKHYPIFAFRCKECEKDFKSKTSLKHHLKVYGHHEDYSSTL